MTIQKKKLCKVWHSSWNSETNLDLPDNNEFENANTTVNTKSLPEFGVGLPERPELTFSYNYMELGPLMITY